MIPTTIKSLPDQAFFSCYSLAAMSIPDNVTTIGSAAFAYCYGLATVAIGKAVTSIGNRAFASCTSLAAIVVDPLNPAYASRDGVLFDRNRFGFNVTGTAGIPIVVEASTNLAGGGWTSLRSCTLTNGSI